MANGKLPNEILKRILHEVPTIERDDVLIGAKIGVDTAQIDFGEEVCVLSTDPITGAVENIGAIGVTISVNDIATAGAEPVGLLLTILAPVGTTHEQIEEIQRDATMTANQLGVQIVGGHTEITSAVNQCVLSVAVIGRMNKVNLMDSSRIEAGDVVAVSKSLGLEGSAILASDRREDLEKHLSDDEMHEANSYLDRISVLEEGRIGAELGVQYMHDITEGGLFGAIYEAAEAIGKGITLKGPFPFTAVTKKIAAYFSIDPHRLISSGSMLLIIPREKIEEAKQLFSEKNVPLHLIGEVTEEGVFIEETETLTPIDPPTKDTLYQALSKKEDRLLLLATDNQDKAKEMKELVSHLPFQVQTKKEAGLGDLEIIEDGRSLEENALIKVRALASHYPEAYILADDTGLFVEALDGQPGIHAARYAGEHCSYRDNCDKMMAAMKGKENRAAYFETAAALVLPDGSSHVFFGQVHGAILDAPKGTNGFGYDALFQPVEDHRSFAEMDDVEKNQISHRKRALEKVIQFLEQQRS